jgi:hypothetical protein
MLYFAHMETKDLKSVLGRIETWPKEAQDELLRSMTEIETRYSEVYHVSDDERAALKRSAEDIRKHRFAGDGDVTAVFGRPHHA